MVWNDGGESALLLIMDIVSNKEIIHPKVIMSPNPI